MSSSRKIGVVTSSRADYGLLKNLLLKIESEPNLDLFLFVTGSHLSPEFGNTVEEIIIDGLKITKKLEIIMSSDSEASICKSLGLAMISFSDCFENYKPDLLLILGDRYEMMAASCSALIMKIPICHIHGGEKTKGVYTKHIMTGKGADGRKINQNLKKESFRRRNIMKGVSSEFSEKLDIHIVSKEI